MTFKCLTKNKSTGRIEERYVDQVNMPVDAIRKLQDILGTRFVVLNAASSPKVFLG